MTFDLDHITIAEVQKKDALELNKMLVSNTDRFLDHLPNILDENSTLAQTRRFIKKKRNAAARGEEYVYVVKCAGTRDIMGMIVLKNIDKNKRSAEFSYCIGKRYRGKGITSLAIKQLTKNAFEHLGLETLQIYSHKTNLSSIKVAVDSGFCWKGTLLEALQPLNRSRLDLELFEYVKPQSIGFS